MDINPSNISCGVYQLEDLDYECSEIISNVAQDIIDGEEEGWDTDEKKYAFLVFSDSDRSKNGLELCKYIRDHKLGSCLQSRAKTNPNTDNLIRVWVWGVNRDAVLKSAGKKMPVYNDEEYD